MGWLTGIHDIQAISPDSRRYQALNTSPQEAEKSIMPVTAFTFPLGGDGQGSILAVAIPPTLP
jgi:hypothetical protein